MDTEKHKSDIVKLRNQYRFGQIKKNTALRILNVIPKIVLAQLGYAELIEFLDAVVKEIEMGD